jgi:molybdopterin synthase sulfur carrier subunit
MIMIRVILPQHLRILAHIHGEVHLDVAGPATLRSALDALEACYPMLRGTIRDHVTQERRPFIRFFACEQDLSNDLPDTQLPDTVASGAEPLLVVGAIAGG